VVRVKGRRTANALCALRDKPGGVMKFKSTVAISVLCSATAWCQNPAPAGERTGPGVQAPQDSKEQEVLKTCKTPPQGRGGGQGKGKGKGPAPAAAAGPRDYTV